MRLPAARGPLGEALRSALSDVEPTLPESLVEAACRTAGPLSDDDLHLSLWVMYELHYRGFDEVDPALEWAPGLLVARRRLESVFEAALRDRTTSLARDAARSGGDVPDQIEFLVNATEGADLARFVHREATVEQALQLFIQRSIYTLKESDPTAFVLPRIDGPAKAALAELQYDEYGGGQPDRLHSALFQAGMAGCGLDPSYGAYVDQVPGHVLAVNNAMSLFGLHRRLRGAALGHLAAFEATSSLPCRRIAAGIRRLGMSEAMWRYFDEHVEADAVHEQVALRDICGRAVDQEPRLRDDVLFGAAVCQLLEAASGARTLADWRAGRNSLVPMPVAVPA